MILYVQSVYIMRDKINYANCMKYKCEQCRYNKRCEKEENKYEIQNKQQRMENNRDITRINKKYAKY